MTWRVRRTEDHPDVAAGKDQTRPVGSPNPADAEPPPRRERREAGRARNHETGEPPGGE